MPTIEPATLNEDTVLPIYEQLSQCIAERSIAVTRMQAVSDATF